MEVKRILEPWHLALFYGSSSISTAVCKEFPSLLFLSNPLQLLPHLQNHLEGHLRRSPKNPMAVTLLSAP